MNQYRWVAMIAMTGWLVLALGSYRGRQVGGKKTLLWAIAWLGVFLLVTGVFVVIGG